MQAYRGRLCSSALPPPSLPPDALCRHVGQCLQFWSTAHDLSFSQWQHWSINSGDPVAGEFGVLPIQARY